MSIKFILAYGYFRSYETKTFSTFVSTFVSEQTIGRYSGWPIGAFHCAFTIHSGEKLAIVIAIGYGETEGVAHKSKTPEAVSFSRGNTPQWFKNGIHAALLAPTALNQQKFKFTLNGNKVSAKAGLGFYSKIDLGIAKYHFEVAAGKDNFTWA